MEVKEFISKENKNNDLEKTKKVIPLKVIAIIVAAIVVVAVIIGFIIYNNRFDVRDYISVSYVGANGYATPEFSIDSEALKDTLIGDLTDSNKLAAINNLVNSIEVTSDATDVSNGDKIKVYITYDTSYEEAAGVKLNLTEYTMKVEDVSSGTKISLFDTVSVTFQGISPEATILISNDYTDEYLSTLTFTADKTENISFGDTVTVTCDQSYEDIARHGYIIDSSYAIYTADKLGQYISGVSDIDTSVLSEIITEATNAIQTQTADTTFRMLYKATKNQDYLKQVNIETASNITLESKYLLCNGTNGSDYNNVIVLIFSATVANQESSETLYFAFSYYNSYITVDGNFDMIRDTSAENYDVGTDKDALINALINSQKERYTVYQLNN